MKTEEILKYILPKEFVEYFDLISIKEESEEMTISLDEKFVPPPEHSDKTLESKGFGPAISITDFPIRNRHVILKIRRRKWKDKETGKTYTREWELKAKGTNYTKEFASFLKGMPR